jgi:hypothetical protein
MARLLFERVQCWLAVGGIRGRHVPRPSVLKQGIPGTSVPCRPGAGAREIVDWELSHGYRLPDALRVWLMISNGLDGAKPFIHPTAAIRPMGPVVRSPGALAQPESWFEMGNPGQQAIGIDLAYQLPGGGCPIFTSGDQATSSPPRIIARNFEEWFLNLLRHRGREYWLDPEFEDFGDPWQAHRRHARQAVAFRVAAGHEPREI